MVAIDIILNTDIEVENGDFKIGYSDQQHINHILQAEKGQFYQYPEIGYGTNRLVNANINIQTEKQKIKKTLEDDNYSLANDQIKITTNELGEIMVEIDAQRIW
jgi:hypothetical protein